ncbi:MAG TPA: CHAT domain-containing protein [Polyangiaceae bacterium]|nr:CHAT domain-containing protein [Polyangiaceae bacterium]
MIHIGKTISVELLRAGPPHNQLLSPLTQYLALCDGHAGETLRLPFEHHDFVLQMQALRYQQGTELNWRARFAQVARDMADVLRQIPGLATTLGRGRADGGELVHVEAVMTASELALLPFEAADSPSTFASAGLPLSVQTVLPVSLTRRNRRYTGADVKWPRRPKILIVVASPPGFVEVPALAHVMAVRKALEPWIGPPRAKREEAERMAGAPQTNIEELVTVLDRASIQRLHEACAASPEPYTHIHILAHGAVRAEGVSERFTLAFHGPNGDPELVDGRQLAAALRPHAKGGSGSLLSPTVITIASCDAGNVGDVMIPGGSIAHDLHEAGIPLVIASQFPLTFAGSVVLAETLYERLLWGDDPRVVLHDVRQRLHLLRHGHDWASIVAYAALPPDLDQQLTWVRAYQARRAAEAALAAYDHESPDIRESPLMPSETASARLAAASTAPMRTPMQKVHEQLKAARQRLLGAIPPEQSTSDRNMLIELYGMLATMDKREAEVMQRCADPKDKNPTRKARQLLLSAQQHYKKGLSFNRANHWHATQYLFLCGILGQRSQKSIADWMTVARFSSREETRDGTPSQRAWAYASLLELAVLGVILGTDTSDPSERLQNAKEDAEAMLALVSMRSFEVYSTVRQFQRYKLWHGLQHPEAERLIGTINEVLDAEGESQPGGSIASGSLRPSAAQSDRPHSAPPESDERLVDGGTRPPPNGAVGAS